MSLFSELVANILLAAVSSSTSVALLRRFIQRGRPKGVDLVLDARELAAATAEIQETLATPAEGAHTHAQPDSSDGRGRPGHDEPRRTGQSSVPTTTTPAELEALAIMKLYGRELLDEAGRIAKRASADQPSRAHVRQAADRIGVLRDRAGAATDLALALGSILVGGAVSYQINLWTGGQAAEGIALWMAIALAVGVGVVVGAAVVKWRRT